MKKEIKMWKAKLKNGNEVSELNTQWNDIEEDVEELLLITNEGKTIYLPKKMEKYFQFKTASVELGKKNVDIESRVIGFKLGNNIVKIRVNEKTNNIKVETENA